MVQNIDDVLQRGTVLSGTFRVYVCRYISYCYCSTLILCFKSLRIGQQSAESLHVIAKVQKRRSISKYEIILYESNSRVHSGRRVCIILLGLLIIFLSKLYLLIT